MHKLTQNLHQKHLICLEFYHNGHPLLQKHAKPGSNHTNQTSSQVPLPRLIAMNFIIKYSIESNGANFTQIS